MSDLEESEREDSEGSFIATQTERDILRTLNEVYGKLPRDVFIQRLCTEHDTKDLQHFRQSLYDLSKQSGDSVPYGKLIARKDTTNSGGKSAEIKLSEDIYILYHFINGEDIDISELLCAKSRRALKTRETMLVQNQSDQSPHSTRNTDYPGQNVSSVHSMETTLREFCTALVTEMRKDRDLLHTEVRNLQSDTVLLSAISADVSQLKNKMDNITLQLDRVQEKQRIIEQRQKEMEHDRKDNEKLLHSIRVKSAEYEGQFNEIRHMFTSLDDHLKALHKESMNISDSKNDDDKGSTQKSFSDVVKTVVHRPQFDKSAQLRYQNQEAKSQSFESVSRSHDPQQTLPKTVDTTNTNNAISGNTQITGSSRTNNNAVILQRQDTTQFIEGFLPVEKREKYCAFYVGGIVKRGESSTVLANIEAFVNKKGACVRSIRLLKETGNIISVKLVVKKEGSGDLGKTDFWPEGIVCRTWIPKTP